MKLVSVNYIKGFLFEQFGETMAYDGFCGMMGGYGAGFGWLYMLLYTLLLVGLVVLVFMWIMKLWKQMEKNEKKR